MKNRGFTLIEILVVVSIISIILLIAIFSFPKYIRLSYKSTAIANARNCLSVINTQQIEGEQVVPPKNCETDDKYESCSCTVSGFAGSVTCKIVEGGSVSCQEDQ